MTQILESQDIGQYRVDIEYDHHYDYSWNSTLNHGQRTRFMRMC